MKLHTRLALLTTALIASSPAFADIVLYNGQHK